MKIPNIKALCARLSTCLELLQQTLLDPIPEYLKENLTVEDLPSRTPAFKPDATQLGRYHQEITQLLINGSLQPKSAIVMEDLLCELIDYFADTLKALRWLKTEIGLIAIE